MEYYKKLNGNFKKSKPRLVFGIIFIISAIGYILARNIYKANNINVSDWILCGLLFINGIMNILGGKGYIIGNKPFIHINNEFIKMRPLNLTKKINWNEIEQIEFNNKDLRIIPETIKFRKTSLNHLNARSVMEIKDILKEIAENKGIEIVELKTTKS